jgi:hypothetical protein
LELLLFNTSECHVYASLINNTDDGLQTLVGDNGRNITLSYQLETPFAVGKNMKFKPMASSADYYVKVRNGGLDGSICIEFIFFPTGQEHQLRRCQR